MPLQPATIGHFKLAYLAITKEELMIIRYSLIESDNPQIVTIQGKELSTEEAALTWEAMTTAEHVRYQGMTDLQIVTAIYSDPAIGYNYLSQE